MGFLTSFNWVLMVLLGFCKGFNGFQQVSIGGVSRFEMDDVTPSLVQRQF